MFPPLEPNAIYAALYWRPDGKFHWALIVADDPVSGHKLHATNLVNFPSWCYANDDFDVSSEWKPLVILARIGTSKTSANNDIDKLLRAIPMSTPDCDAPEPFTCRIWFREAVRVLVAQGMVECLSIDTLGRELTGLADEHGNAVALGRSWKLHNDLDSVRFEHST